MLAVGYILYERLQELDNKVVILITNIDGTNPENYRVNEILISNLEKSLKDYDDVVLIPLDQVITEQEGSTTASKVGLKYHADLVLWGWYGVTNSDVLLTVHIENLTGMKYTVLDITDEIQVNNSLRELDNFTTQINLSEQMADFTLFFAGLVRYEAKDYTEAIKLFSELLSSNNLLGYSDYQGDVYFYRGNAYFSNENFDLAVVDFSQSAKFEYARLTSIINRGCAYENQGKYEEAIADYSEAIRLSPQTAIAYYNRGSAYLSVGQLDKSIADLTTAIQLDPKYAPSYNNRGLAFNAIAEYDLAIKDLSEAIRLNPKLFQAFVNRANAYFRLSKYQESVIDYTKAVEIAPDFAEAYAARGDVYFVQSQYDKAFADYNHAISLGQHTAKTICSRGIIYMYGGQYDNAIIDFNWAIQIDSSYDLAYANRGTTYLLQNKNELAIEDFRKVLLISTDPGRREIAEKALKSLGVEPIGHNLSS